MKKTELTNESLSSPKSITPIFLIVRISLKATKMYSVICYRNPARPRGSLFGYTGGNSPDSRYILFLKR